MRPVREIPATLAAVSVLVLAPAIAASAAKPQPKQAVSSHALRTSEELWATIDVCDPPDQADTVGVRGSMPGDGQPHDTMYMHFRLQYMNTTTKHWVDLANGAEAGYITAGSAKTARQTGWSFKLAGSQPTFELRGVVTFQWRRGTAVVESFSRPTTAGHRSLAGADPPSYSAATCSVD
jgi:hypothetical protein